MLESLFNKLAGLQASSFIKKRLQHRCFAVKLAKFLRIPILKNICERLFLKSAFFRSETTILERISDQYSHFILPCNPITLHKKWNFPLRISLVNVTKSAVSCGFGHIYQRNPQWKTFLCSVSFLDYSISDQYFHFTLPVNTRKLKAFWYLQGM